jgi:hypothetical protein
MMLRNSILLSLFTAVACAAWLIGSWAVAAPHDMFGQPYPVTPHPEPNCQPVPIMLPTPTPMMQTGPMLSAPIVPAPAPSVFVPGPGELPPPMIPAPAAPPAGPLEEIAPGGSVSPQFGLPAGPEVVPGIPNPLSMPVSDDEFAWDAIADVVSDYFSITSEQRAVRGMEGWSEGRIETAPQTGATIFEPHRGDSVGWFNRWESTFQTIRRRAVVRVIPEPAGYLVEVEVWKELEELPRPEQSTVGAASFANPGSLPSYRTGRAIRVRSSPCWIPLGRDMALEQRMLAEIHARLTGAAVGGTVFSASAP